MDKKIVLQNGVVFTYDSDDGSDIVHDINIPDGVEEVELCMDVAMEDTGYAEMFSGRKKTYRKEGRFDD